MEEKEVKTTEINKEEISKPVVQEVYVPEDEHVAKPNFMAYVPLVTAIISLFANFCVTVLGWEPLPYSSEEVNIGVATTLQVLATLWAWWKNNNVTKESRKREAVANQVIPRKGKKKK